AAGGVGEGRGGRAGQALPGSEAGGAVQGRLVGADHVGVGRFFDVAGDLLAELRLVGGQHGGECRAGVVAFLLGAVGAGAPVVDVVLHALRSVDLDGE